MQNDLYHVPVMLTEVIEGLKIQPSGIYVDCTFGGGGHALAILSHLNDKGKLVVFDQDEAVRANIPKDDRLIFIAHNFRHLQRFLRLNKIFKVDGILADLGVSSHQFDVPDRGFSTRFEGLMDMRMDQKQELTAATVLKTYSEEKLHKLFERFGEVTNAKTLARTIVKERVKMPLSTMNQFRNALTGIIKGNPNKYLAQVFQALRIEVNDELGSLSDMLEQVPDILNQGGRILIITFHSIEDRIVKNFFKSKDEVLQNDLFGTKQPNFFNIITKKPITASDKERKLNSRARSAKLRIAERI